jgi:hypothetical protein
MLEEILREIKDYFIRDVYPGHFVISGGVLQGADGVLKEGQYYKIDESVLNDGVYKHPYTGLADEEFDGELWALAVPREIISLCADVEAWKAKNAKALMSPYLSESFGTSGYSYSRGYGGSGSGTAQVLTWQGAFSDRLAKWRKAGYEFTGRRHDGMPAV